MAAGDTTGRPWGTLGDTVFTEAIRRSACIPVYTRRVSPLWTRRSICIAADQNRRWNLLISSKGGVAGDTDLLGTAGDTVSIGTAGDTVSIEAIVGYACILAQNKMCVPARKPSHGREFQGTLYLPKQFVGVHSFLFTQDVCPRCGQDAVSASQLIKIIPGIC